MLRDANPDSFAGIYIVCGYTDLRYGIDSLAAIIERHYNMSLFVPNTLFLFCGHSSNKIKGLLWEGDGFLLFCSVFRSAVHSFTRLFNAVFKVLKALHSTFSLFLWLSFHLFHSFFFSLSGYGILTNFHFAPIRFLASVLI